nr:glutamate ABC transporter substrate-binding protein [Kibdelosporangium sp. MJ126-NF4]CTQ93532.1 Glutamine ABC transporter, periplasmic glutamine-binding protein (TC 3.A.1.3.2) [Kibdelosporangium sp. MJ126-NF4]
MKRVAVLLVSAFALTACGGPGRPVDLAVVTSANRPEPDGSGPGQAGTGGTQAPSCGDPTASLRPNGLSIAAGSTMADIRQRGRLIAGVDQNTYLFGFRNPATNNLEGFDIDMAKQVAKAIFNDESKIQYKVLTSRDREKALAEGQVDIVTRTYTVNCERLQQVAFSAVYYTTGQRVLVPKGSSIASMDDLGGKKVCANVGSTSLTQIAKHPAKPVPWSVLNWSDCLVLLQQGQVAAMSTDEPILVGMAAQDPTVKIVGPKLTEEPYGIGVPKTKTDMVKFVNAVLERMRGDGSWQQSYDRWVAPRLGESATQPTPKYRD